MSRQSARNRALRISNQDALDALKLARGCIDCGYNAHPRALDFDHVDGNKAAGISRMMRDSIGLDRILTEVAQCEVRCANCHRIRTAERGPNWRPSRDDGQAVLLL